MDNILIKAEFFSFSALFSIEFLVPQKEFLYQIYHDTERQTKKFLT